MSATRVGLHVVVNGVPGPKPSSRAWLTASFAALTAWLAAEWISPKLACGPTYMGMKCQPADCCWLTQDEVRLSWPQARSEPPM